ncbi:Putative diheme cytochrome c-553 [Sandaracinus amylolyticus]|uniref:Putative diheme cytochrome c-553 n=1 Tax=Sandaracinus amylolyticus TaxID=927083 RepID=A0A0F6W1Z7_9BACT|nr:Putative diheme cytochrome c-553 [Sandaracinus amylolyticus]
MLIAIAVVVGALVVGAAGLVGWAYTSVGSRLERTWDVAVPALELPSDAASLARGEHLLRHVCACVECHGDDLGGRAFVDEPALGRVMGSNLTTGRGGVGGALDADDWARAILHGVGSDHRSLVIMPSEDYTHLSAPDLAALIAYARTVPPVDRETTIELTPLAQVLIATGELPAVSAELIDHDVTLPAAVAPGPTLEHGEYLARMCTGCHGRDFQGQVMAAAPPGTPPVPGIGRRGMTGWTQADFERALRRGQKPGGVAMHPFMPSRYYAGMTDDEVTALWTYLQTVE